MTIPDQVAVTLTDEQLAEVVALCATEPIAAIVQAWRFIDPEWDSREPRSVKPYGWSLPRSQWSAIGSALADYRPASPIGSVNLLLDWMNVGPSAREDDE